MNAAKFFGLSLFLTLACLMPASLFAAAEEVKKAEPSKAELEAKAGLKTAIFVRNRGGREMDSKIDIFSDELSARLSEKGFAVMDWKDVIQKFREANEPDEAIFKSVRTLMAIGTTTGTTDSAMTTAEQSVKIEPENSVVGQGLAGGVAKASALRVAQMLDADYIIVASLGKMGQETREFKGEGTIYKTDNKADIYSLPMTIKVLDGNSGQSIYGDVFTSSERILQNASIKVSVDNMPDRLIDSGTAKLAENISDKVQRIRDAVVKATATVPFTIECNIDGATIELDGAAIGTAPGNFNASPGIHQLSLTRQYFETWEKSVNIFANQKISVSLELSAEGLAKYKDITAFKQEQELQKKERESQIKINEEQSKADAGVKEGLETALKNSYIRSEHFQEGLTTLVRTGDDGPVVPVVPVPPPQPPAPPMPPAPKK